MGWIKSYPYEIVHLDGCDEVAFRMRKLPGRGAPLIYSDILLRDRTHPTSRDVPCETCGEILDLLDMRIEWTSEYLFGERKR